ncbi:hypothetical protein FRB94_012169 [Tulasnella sp. JGI-2019a]|nr:hypothetical protein FRB94_012169 [Tulasnella sp. JGI-2019a]
MEERNSRLPLLPDSPIYIHPRRQRSSALRVSLVLEPPRIDSETGSPEMSPTESNTISLSKRTGSVRGGPLTRPSSPEWRRQRLLAIGTPEGSPAPHSRSGTHLADGNDERTPLANNRLSASYGSLPPAQKRVPQGRLASATSFFFSGQDFESDDGQIGSRLSRIRSQGSMLFDRFKRPVSAYDAVEGFGVTGDQPEEAVRINGVRVWYSSFTSVDWLHDAIKDSARVLHLRKKRNSLRGRLRNAADRSTGWIIVTIVGILTAIVAFLIVRAEQLLFDLKEGYCTQSWWKAKKFCCRYTTDVAQTSSASYTRLTGGELSCHRWRTWSEVLGSNSEMGEPRVGGEDWIIEYASYTVIALLLAVASCILTLRLTASTSFVTRKESAIRGPDFEPEQKAFTSPVESARQRKILYFAAGSGIPEIKTILSGFVIHGYLGGRTLFTKSVGLALSVASGLSLGKEGPFVHIASCVGNIVSRFFPKYENNEGKRREILSAAAAAGVAVAFGAPIGGVLFSLEEVSYFFPAKVMWRSFWCAMIAAATLGFLDPFGTGKLVLFQVTYDKDWHAFELVPFLLLGVFGGVYGAYFSKLNYRWSRYVRNGTMLKTHPVFEVVLITLITSCLGFLNLYTRMGGTELVYNLFAECTPGGDTHGGLCINEGDSLKPVIGAIALALVVKGALTVVTFGIKLPAGIFIPSLGVGACLGRIVGIGIQSLQWKHPDLAIFNRCSGDGGCVIPGVYAMVGAAATLSGVTRTTVSLAVIMFELTDSLTYVVPIMLSVLVAKTVADALEPKGIYDLVIELNQLPYLDAKQEYLWGAYQLLEIADKHVEVIYSDQINTVKSLRDKLLEAAANGTVEGFPLVTRERKLVGYIGTNELEHALTQVAEDGNGICHFYPVGQEAGREFDRASIPSTAWDAALRDPFDFTIYMDRAPLTVQPHAPMEMVQQMFVKLGARYVIVTDSNGQYQGIINKVSWIAFLGELEEKSD